MRQENGEWRIAAAPNALLVPRDLLRAELHLPGPSQASLYFFDPTGRILVPEAGPRAPRGQQLTTALVQALLLGPRPSLAGSVGTFFPPGLAVSLSVPVSKGVAQVSLSGPDPAPLSPQTTRMMLAQLAWTLRQDPSVTTFTLTVAGHVVTDAAAPRPSPSTSTRVRPLRPGRATPAPSSTPYAAAAWSPGRLNHLTTVDRPVRHRATSGSVRSPSASTA